MPLIFGGIVTPQYQIVIMFADSLESLVGRMSCGTLVILSSFMAILGKPEALVIIPERNRVFRLGNRGFHFPPRKMFQVRYLGVADEGLNIPTYIRAFLIENEYACSTLVTTL